MHFSHGVIPLQIYYQLYGSLILVGTLGGFMSLCLTLMTIHGADRIELAVGFSFFAFVGFVRMLIPPWSTSTIRDEEDLYFSFDGNSNHNNTTKNYHSNMLCELAVDTVTLGEETKNDDAVPICRNSPCSICLQCFEIGQEVSVGSACKHSFHSKCLQRWVQKSPTCPYCRHDLEKPSRNGERRKLPGQLGVFEGVFDSIFDFTS